MNTQHSTVGALMRCDYNDMPLWRFRWFFNNIKHIGINHICYFCKNPNCKQSQPTLSQMIRCGLFGQHKYVRTLKLFFTSMECIEVNCVHCDNPACPTHKYVVEQWDKVDIEKDAILETSQKTI